MSTAVQVEIVIPESMGKVEALAKVSTSLQGVIARKRREWRASRGEIAVLGPNVEVLRVTLPNRRKGEPFKDRIVRMLETGKSPGRIALELGVTERYVRILARQVKEQPKPQVQLRLW